MSRYRSIIITIIMQKEINECFVRDNTFMYLDTHENLNAIAQTERERDPTEQDCTILIWKRCLLICINTCKTFLNKHKHIQYKYILCKKDEIGNGIPNKRIIIKGVATVATQKLIFYFKPPLKSH